MTVHVEGTAGARHTRIRADLGVVLDQLDILGSQLKLLERLQGHHKRTGGCALSHGVPGVVLSDLSSGHKLDGNLSAVAAALGYVEAAPCKADASALLGRVGSLGIRHCLLIDRAHGVHDLLHGILRVNVAVDIGLAFTADILIAELERIHSQLLGHHVH